jgi:quercetin 2,3-dioxygenase
MEMAQLWLNLPSSKKMTAPAYQAILSTDIPSIPLHAVPVEGEEECAVVGSVRIIAGSLNGQDGAATTHTPVELFDVTIQVSIDRLFYVPLTITSQ